ncbi:universal stress protein [Flavobacterium lacus]|uniref:Nucleotide-binding universal stress UspA family protein n=1 Tax=Flavobacterium lacus TaxID=1353778 RepID=A0A328X1I9_9FLAO|nr:universal stress protein [Flavobacterium lacus]RAR49079.1 nucleotide-binding universal stress UspA family protein [Flavobacterium lacus]
MKRILFPTDFSEASNNAFVYALKLADAIKGELITLHAYELPQLHMGGLPTTLKDVYDSIELENFENFKDQIPVLRDIAEKHNLGHVKISNILKHGDLIWTIKKVTKEENIDYVVMGTKGASGLKETFLGSNTGTVITELDTYVIGVPEESEFSGIQNIVFTTRFREKDLKALKKVLKLAKLFDAKVHCLYIKTKKDDVNPVIIEDWKFLFKNEKVVFHIFEDENVKQTILNFIDSYNVDMLAMLNYKRGFFEELFKQSLTQKLSYHVKVPLLAIHESRLD